MIIEAFLFVIYIFVYAITRVVTLFPDTQLPETFSTTFSEVGAVLAPLNAVVDIPTLFFLISLVVSIELAYLTWKGINWIIRKIPTIS